MNLFNDLVTCLLYINYLLVITLLPTPMEYKIIPLCIHDDYNNNITTIILCTIKRTSIENNY